MTNGVSTRFKYIDSLRGIAALYVVAGHALNEYYFKLSSDVGLPFEWLKQLTSGLVGVFLFFAISGFVIPASFRGGGKRFVIRRFFRLYPLFWFSITPNILRFLFRGCTDFSLGAILANITMIPAAFNERFICNVFWTLAHELLFYAICLVLYVSGWIDQSRKIALCALGFAVGYWGFRFGQWIGFWPGAATFFQKTIWISLSIMFWGALWRFFLEGRCQSWLEKAALAFLPIQCALLVVCRPFYTRAEAKLNFPVSFGVSLALAIALFILGTTVMKLKSRILAWCGLVSYSLYLFHMIVITYVMRWVQSSYANPPPLWAFELIVLILSCCSAALGYYFVERPFIALGKRLTEKAAPIPTS